MRRVPEPWKVGWISATKPNILCCIIVMNWRFWISSDSSNSVLAFCRDPRMPLSFFRYLCSNELMSRVGEDVLRTCSWDLQKFEGSFLNSSYSSYPSRYQWFDEELARTLMPKKEGSLRTKNVFWDQVKSYVGFSWMLLSTVYRSEQRRVDLLKDSFY